MLLISQPMGGTVHFPLSQICTETQNEQPTQYNWDESHGHKCNKTLKPISKHMNSLIDLSNSELNMLLHEVCRDKCYLHINKLAGYQIVVGQGDSLLNVNTSPYSIFFPIIVTSPIACGFVFIVV